MTKEELEKEATDYALEWGDKTDGTYACCRDGYLAGAEPREKRIAELEKELEFEKSVNGEFTAIEKLRELEKENAELKDTLEGYKKIAKWCDKCDKIANLEKENAELKEDRNSLQELVTYYQTNFCQEYNNS